MYITCVVVVISMGHMCIPTTCISKNIEGLSDGNAKTTCKCTDGSVQLQSIQGLHKQPRHPYAFLYVTSFFRICASYLEGIVNLDRETIAQCPETRADLEFRRLSCAPTLLILSTV